MTTERERIASIGFYGLVVLFAYLVYLLFRPFLVPLAWAGVLAICFYPVHSRFERRLGRSQAALLSTVLVAILVIVPILAVASAFVSEALRVLEHAPRLLTQAPESVHRWLQAALSSIPGGEAIDAAGLLADTAGRLAANVSSQVAAVLQNAVLSFVYLVITIFAMFFFFRDAPTVMRAVRHILPFEPELRERLIEQTRLMVNASVTSGLIVATVQGLLGGLTFWALGLTGPVFWGVVMGLLCLLPLGAWLVWGPAAIWLMLTGRIVRGLVLAGIGFAVVSGIDNFLRPLLLSGRSEMNGLLLFVSLLGGIAAFGAVGLVLGPVLMAAAVGLFEAYTRTPAVQQRSARGPSMTA
jgi:predicted PurR-regulated permease PerM